MTQLSRDEVRTGAEYEGARDSERRETALENKTGVSAWAKN
jgi:hypothetical protein